MNAKENEGLSACRAVILGMSRQPEAWCRLERDDNAAIVDEAGGVDIRYQTPGTQTAGAC
jgi:hypothetical protein